MANIFNVLYTCQSAVAYPIPILSSCKSYFSICKVKIFYYNINLFTQFVDRTSNLEVFSGLTENVGLQKVSDQTVTNRNFLLK